MAAVLVMICLPHNLKGNDIKQKDTKLKDRKKDTLNLPWQELHLSSPYHTQKRYGLPNNMLLEKLVRQTLRDSGISDSTWNLSYDELMYEVTFICEADNVENIIMALDQIGIGTIAHTGLSVIPCSVHMKQKYKQYNNLNDYDDDEYDYENDYDVDYFQKKSQFLRSIKSRMTVAQVLEAVTQMATINFDFVLWLVVACMLSAIGLANANAVLIAASMIVCPLMGPIMSGCFGVLIREKKLSSLALWTEILGFSFCVVYGFVFGLITGYFGEEWGAGPWPTIEMSSRGTIHALWEGLLVAFLCGAACALATLGANMASWVGTAISASLLPPAVNAGMCWALALILKMKAFIQMRALMHSTNSTYNISSLPMVSEALLPRENYSPYYSKNMSRELAILGIFSLLLTIENVMGIFAIGLFMLKVKEITPSKSMLPSPTFWKEDVKVAREYNLNKKDDDSRPLGARLMEEWARIHNIDLNKVKAGEEIDEDQLAEIFLTFKEIVETVEKDKNYHRVMSSIPERVLPQPLSQQLPPEMEILDRQYTVENILRDTLQENPNLTPFVVQRVLREDGGVNCVSSSIQKVFESPFMNSNENDRKYATIGRYRGLQIGRKSSFKNKRSSSIDCGVHLNEFSAASFPPELAAGLRQRRPSNISNDSSLTSKASSNINAAIANARRASILLTVPQRTNNIKPNFDHGSRTPIISSRRPTLSPSDAETRFPGSPGRSNIHGLRRKSINCIAETEKIRQIAKQGRRPTNVLDKQKLLANFGRRGSAQAGYTNPAFGATLGVNLSTPIGRVSADNSRRASLNILQLKLKDVQN